MPDSSIQPGEALAAPLRRHLLDRFPADRAYPRDAFRAEGMPPPIAAFLGQTLDRWAEMERDRFREDWNSNGWFDADNAGVQRAEQAFFDALGRSARVPAEAWEDTLGGAVDLVVRFLTVPARALTDAIFEGEADPLPAEVIRRRLSLFSAYPYLTDVATAYLDRKRPEPLDPSDLFALLDRIDRRFVSDYGLGDWLSLLAPLFALARYAPSLDGVPVPLLRRFFDAKGEDDLADLLAEHSATVLDETALRDALAPAFPEAPADEAPDPDDTAAAPGVNEPEAIAEDAAEAGSESDAPADAEPLPESPAPLADEGKPAEPDDPVLLTSALLDADDEPPHDDAPDSTRAASSNMISTGDTAAPDEADSTDDADGARPLWERFAERTSDGDSVNARFGPDESDPRSAAAPMGDDDAVPLWKRFFARPDPEPSAPAPVTTTVEANDTVPTSEPETPSAPAPERRDDSLDALEQRVLGPMPPSQRKRFIKHLFGGDAGKYVTVLHTLDDIGSWTEASRVIARDVFRPSRVNIYGEHAVAFTDAVEARYRT